MSLPRQVLPGADDNVAFPHGTYWMRKFARVVCETADEAQPALAQAQSAPLAMGRGVGAFAV